MVYRRDVSSERTIPTTIHGRYLVDLADRPEPHLLLVGFHGYAEQAVVQMERLRAMRGRAAWSLVSIQGLHRFYRSGGEVLDCAAHLRLWAPKESDATA